MNTINLTPEVSDLLRARLAAEYGEVCATNFALAILIDQQRIELTNTREYNEALLARVAKQDETIAELQTQLGSRAQEMKAAARARREARETTQDECLL